MEIQGRECKEVKIGEHTYWFIEKYITGDARRVRVLMTDDSGKKSFTEKTIYTNMPELFLVFCKRVDTDITPTAAFFDGLPIKDSEELQVKVLEAATDVFTVAQQKTKSSKTK